jgi:hypothetical protein
MSVSVRKLQTLPVKADKNRPQRCNPLFDTIPVPCTPTHTVLTDGF